MAKSKTSAKKSVGKKAARKQIRTRILEFSKKDKKIISQEPAFANKHPLCDEVAHFYSMPGQLNLVLHGVPFHLIKDQFVRFHAVHSTVIGWKFTIVYTVLLVSLIANALLFNGRLLDYILWIFLIAVSMHAIINLYLAHKTRKGEDVSLPIVTDAARRISM